MLILTVIQGPDSGKRLELPDHEPQLIGRSSESLPITDTTISRRHAELTPDGGVWYIRDLASQNGTYVNGVRLVDRVRLRSGDQIRTGSTVFVFGEVEGEGSELVRLVGDLDEQIERTLDSNEDSIVLAEPEPRAAAAEHLRMVYQLMTVTGQALPRRELLNRVLDLVMSEFKPDRGVVLLGQGTEAEPLATAAFRQRAGSGFSVRPTGEEGSIGVSRTIVLHAVRSGQGVLSTNAMTDRRFTAGDSVQRLRIRSAICSPIRHRERTFGVIYVDSSIANYTFTADQLALMNAIGQHAGLALANAELYAQKLQTERLAAMGETVASLSHAIKNMLQGLRGGADVVEMGLKKEDLKVARGGWEILKRNLDRIVSLTMNMLAFSRQRSIEPELTPLGRLIEDVAELLEGQCRAKGVALIVDADPEMPPIALDPSLMHQALLNLLTNAVEAVEPGRGVVTVRTTYHAARRATTSAPWAPAMAEIAVIDNGPGIPRDRVGRLFEPFNTTKGARGTGLGLAVTKRIVEEHRGRIVVESSVGQGATFRVFLPADASSAIDPSQTAQPREPRG